LSLALEAGDSAVCIDSWSSDVEEVLSFLIADSAFACLLGGRVETRKVSSQRSWVGLVSARAQQFALYFIIENTKQSSEGRREVHTHA
jgi:hypothetical protein